MSEYKGPSLREIAPSVTVDVGIRSGRPCVKGTALPTAKLWDSFMTGRSIRALAKDHRISEGMVEDVIRYELAQHRGEGLRLGALDELELEGISHD